jgi:septation ring formation regulator EzrA
MTDMKLTLATSLFCVILGIGIIISTGVAYPIINTPLNNLETTIANYLQQANNTLLSSQETINSTQSALEIGITATNITAPSLAASSQLTSNIANNLTTIGATVEGVGQTLASISIAGLSPFDLVGNNISNMAQPLQTAANYLQNVSSNLNEIQVQAKILPNNLNEINQQLENMKGTLSELSSSVNQAQSSLSGTFDDIRFGIILALVGIAGLGVIFLLIGISLLSLRRRSIDLGRLINK